MRGWFGIVCIERYRLFFCRQEISGKLEEIREKMNRKEAEGSAEKESDRIRNNQK